MIRIVDISEAESHLDQWINWALEGDEVVIAQCGKSLAQLVPCSNDDRLHLATHLHPDPNLLESDEKVTR